MTPTQKQAYLACQGTACPYCGSHDITPDPGSNEWLELEFSRCVACDSCGREWRDIYSLSDCDDAEDREVDE